jgi:hypothetical protein
LDLRGNIPTFIHISDGKLNDVKALDLLAPEPGPFYIMDRGYFDFARLYRLHLGAAFFFMLQVRYQSASAVFACGRQLHRSALRSNHAPKRKVHSIRTNSTRRFRAGGSPGIDRISRFR